ncbi:MAG: type II secretion system protein [Firmicutes bacterium]|nr:type II secretion system protein [Bacillota bacterium]
MKKRNGFTLIELLAVIVILAVIALIATPLVMGVIERSKMNSVKDNAYGMIKAAENYMASTNMSGTPVLNDVLFEFPSDTKLDFKGTRPESGYLILDKDGNTIVSFYQSGYCASKEKDKKEVSVTKGKCVEFSVEAPTYDKYREIIPFEAFRLSNGAKIEDGIGKITATNGKMEVTIYNYGTKWQVNATFQAYGGVAPSCPSGHCVLMGAAYYDENNQPLISDNGHNGNGYAKETSTTSKVTLSFTGYDGYSDSMHHFIYNISGSPTYALPPYDIYEVRFTLDKPVSKVVPGGIEVVLKSGKSSAQIKTVEYSTNKSTWTKVTPTLSGSSFKVIVPKDGDYYFRVTNTKGQVSSASSLVKVRTNSNGIMNP